MLLLLLLSVLLSSCLVDGEGFVALLVLNGLFPTFFWRLLSEGAIIIDSSKSGKLDRILSEEVNGFTTTVDPRLIPSLLSSPFLSCSLGNEFCFECCDLEVGGGLKILSILLRCIKEEFDESPTIGEGGVSTPADENIDVLVVAGGDGDLLDILVILLARWLQDFVSRVKGRLDWCSLKLDY